jgi:hypothetical protein
VIDLQEATHSKYSVLAAFFQESSSSSPNKYSSSRRKRLISFLARLTIPKENQTPCRVCLIAFGQGQHEKDTSHFNALDQFNINIMRSPIE